MSTIYRVATAQGKQGKQGLWKSIFPDRENTWNLPKILKIWFYTGNLTSTQGKFGGILHVYLSFGLPHHKHTSNTMHT